MTEPGEYWQRFCEAMDDDFNTARGIGILFDAVRDLNRLLDENKEGSATRENVHPKEILRDMLGMGNILGILSETPKRYFEHDRSSALQQTPSAGARLKK